MQRLPKLYSNLNSARPRDYNACQISIENKIFGNKLKDFANKLIGTYWNPEAFTLSNALVETFVTQINEYLRVLLNHSLIAWIFDYELKLKTLKIGKNQPIITNITLEQTKGGVKVFKCYIIYTNEKDELIFTIGKHLTVKCKDLALHGNLLVEITRIGAEWPYYQDIKIHFEQSPWMNLEYKFIITIFKWKLDISFVKFLIFGKIIKMLASKILRINDNALTLENKPIIT